MFLTVFIVLSMLTSASTRGFHLLVMAPFPDPQNPPAFSAGHSLIPGVLLAMDHLSLKQDILPNHTLDVVIGMSGCEQVEKTALSLIPNLIGEKPLAMIGPICSESSVYVANLCEKTRLNLVQTVLGTTPELDYHNPNTFGMISSTRSYANLLVELALCNKWSGVSILYESRPYFLQTLEVLMEELDRHNISISYTRNIILSPLTIPLTTASKHTRIIIVLASRRAAQSLACLAAGLDFTFPNYQFIFINRKLEEFVPQTDFKIHTTLEGNREMREFDCSKENIRNGIEGSVLLRYSLLHSDQDAYTVSGKTVSEVRDEYKMKVHEACSKSATENSNTSIFLPEKMNLVRYSEFQENYCSTQNQVASFDEFAYPYYDAIWAVAVSLHNILTRNDTTQEELMHPNEMTYLLQKEMSQISFQGVSAQIKFDNSGRIRNTIDIFHINSNLTKINKSALPCDGKIHGLFISNTFPVSYETISTYSMVIGVLLVVGTSMLTVLLHILHFVYRKHHSIKARSPLLNHFIFVGCYVYVLSVILNTVAFTELSGSEKGSCTICNLTFFLNNLGYDMIFGTLCVKMWRLYRIFMQTFKKQQFLSNAVLVLYVLAIILMCMVFHLWMIAFNMQTTPEETEVLATKKGYVQRKRIICQFESIGYTFIPAVYHIILTVSTLTLCILTRNIRLKDFRNSRGILALAYLLAMIWAIEQTIWVVYANDKKDIIYLLHTVASTSTVVLCHVLLTIPVTIRAVVHHKTACNT